MKKLFFTCLLFVGFFKLSSQTWQWAIGEAAIGEGMATCHDASGNIYLAGFLTGTGVIGSFTLSAPGNKAILAKYNPTGTVLWVQSFANANGGAWGVECDNSGNVFLTGQYVQTVTIGNNTLVSGGGNDFFLAKFDNNGAVLWAKTASGSGNNDVSSSVATDAAGNSFITGVYNSTVLVIGTNTLTSLSGTRFFVAKYDPNGNVLWASGNTSGNNVQAKYVDVDGNGNSYVCGFFTSTAVIGTSSIASIAFADFFVTKYDPSGNLLWVITGGGGAQDLAYCVNLDPLGNFYLTGGFSSTVLTIGTNTLTNSGATDVFLAKYNSSGVPIWARKMGGTASDNGYSLASYPGGVYLAGSMFSMQMVVGTNTLNIIYPNDGMFLSHFDSSGNPTYAMSVNGGGDDQMAITLHDCNLYLIGDLMNNNAPVTIGNYSITPMGFESLFIAKLNAGMLNAPPIAVSGNTIICAGQTTTLTATGANSHTWTGFPAGNTVVISPAVSSNYTVTGNSTLACSSTGSLVQTVLVNPLPVLSFTLGKVTLCAGESRTITVGGANSYSWNTGAQTLTLAVAPLVTTGYSVTGTNTITGCAATSTLQLIVSDCAGLADLGLTHEQLYISPNPTNGEFEISVPEDTKGGELLIFNIQGELVLKQNMTSNKFNCSALAKGTYTVRLLQPGKPAKTCRMVIN